MREVVNIGKNAHDVRKSVQFYPYSKVIMNVDEETSIEVGNDLGQTLVIDCPWGTEEIANDILEKLRGYQYQPYTVTGAIVNPAVELGDAVQANGVYGGMFTQDAIFGRTFYCDMSAPEDEQLDHEYTYETPTERRITRQKYWTKSELKIRDDEISARVTKEGGTQESFGWSLLSDEFALYSGSKKVFSCKSDGIFVDGEIRARTGKIGCDAEGNGGFSITKNQITNGKSSYDDENNGVYIGTNGIGLGSKKFWVTSGGSLHAYDATIEGTGKFKGTIYAKNLVFTNDDGTTTTINGKYLTDNTVGNGKISNLNGGKIDEGTVGGSQLGGGSVSKSKCTSDINTSLANGDVALAKINSVVAGTVQCSSLWSAYVKSNNYAFGNNHLSKSSATISGTTIKYVSWM